VAFGNVAFLQKPTKSHIIVLRFVKVAIIEIKFCFDDLDNECLYELAGLELPMYGQGDQGSML
jgi:hypothetical protein